MTASGAEPPGAGRPPQRLATLDLLRGVAILGILAVNIAGLAGPPVATETPNLPHPVGRLDEAAFAVVFVVFEGKMRALLSLLFGASLVLFIGAAESRGRNGELLQARRLGWLLLIGWLHYVLLWWGDILFVYAVAGAIVLVLWRLPDRVLLAIALVVFAGWHGAGMAANWPLIAAEEHVRTGVASAAEAALHRRELDAVLARMAHDGAQVRLGFGAMVADKLATAPLWPVVMTLFTLGETVPLMLLGVVLQRRGFLAGAWPRARLQALAVCGIGLGSALTVMLLHWAWARHFPPLAMREFVSTWTALPHLLMALGYAAALVLVAERLHARAIGTRLEAAGRMAFSNYLATTVAMCALCHGWGLGLYGRIGPAAQLGVVAAWWLVLLGWSRPWLARYRQGPLEWAWRSLTEQRLLPLRKA